MKLKEIRILKRIPADISEFLLESAEYHEKNSFIDSDPICIPHRFSIKQDIEIIGFLVATIAWGNRVSIIRSGNALCGIMDDAPYDFILGASKNELAKLNRFVHRTFNEQDLRYFVDFLHFHYTHFNSLEQAFTADIARELEIKHNQTGDIQPATKIKNPMPQLHAATLEIGEQALIRFREYFFSLPHLNRTEKHVSSVLKNSACKRLNMFLRWMVRKNSPVDFGLWDEIAPKDLYLPLDVHVMRVANQLGIIEGTTTNWQICKDLTAVFRQIIPNDPVKIDFALFGIGIEQKS